jgi:hypothetical protein
MKASRKSAASNYGVEQAVSRLKHAEMDLLAVVRTGTHPHNALLLEAHAFLRESISALARVCTADAEQFRYADGSHAASARGARLV